MAILVTGGAGYIGSHTVQKLLDAGYNVVVFDNLSTGFREAVPSNVELIVGDVRDKKALYEVMIKNSIKSVVHFAAKLVVPDSLENPLNYYDNNTTGVICLAQACIEARVKQIVFSSTAAVYGDSSTDGLVTEETDTSPLNPYGMSKLMSESILKDCDQAYGLRSVSLRYFNVAGASTRGDNGQRTKNATHLIKVASQAACGIRESVGIYGTDFSTPDGTGVRDYIHVEDLAELHVLALKYLEDGGCTDIFNAGYGKGASVREVINTVRKISQTNFRAIEQKRRVGDAALLVADSSKVRKVFSWKPRLDNLELICKTAYEWEKSLHQ